MLQTRRRPAIWVFILATILAFLTITGHGTALSSRVSSPFRSPFGVAVDGQGRIYVGDSDLGQILKLSPRGRVLARFGHFSGGLLGGPGGIAVDARGNVFVVDTGYNRVDVFAPSGRLVASWGHAGKKSGQFDSPIGLAIDSHDNVYVSNEVENGRVQKFSSRGKLLGVLVTHMPFPLGLAVAPDSSVEVVSFGANRVVRLSPSGRKLGAFGSSGHQPGQLNGPAFLGVDRHGTLYVNDRENGRIEAFSATGRFLRVVASKGAAPGGLGTPEGVAVDSADNVYVADENNRDVVKFSPTGKVLAVF